MTKKDIEIKTCADCEETKDCIEIIDYWGKLDCYICEDCNEKRYDAFMERFMERFYG